MLQGMANGATGLAYNIGDVVEVDDAAAEAWLRHGIAEKPPVEEPRSTTRKPPRQGTVGPKK
jgi:hypothetical protein